MLNVERAGPGPQTSEIWWSGVRRTHHSATIQWLLFPSRAETARRVRQRIGAVMLWAMAQGHRADNPAGEAIAGALPKNGKPKTHRRVLPYAKVAGAIMRVRQSDALPATKLLFEFLVLTAGCSLEVRGADWSEIDFSGSTWTVPASCMKARHAHRVPLSDRVLEVLAEARELADGRGLVFPGTRSGRPLSDISKLLRELGIPAVVSRFLSWDHSGNWSDCTVDELPGKTEQSGSRPEPSPLPLS